MGKMFRVSSVQDKQEQGSLQRIAEDGSASSHKGVLLFTPGLRAGAAVNVVLYLHGNMFGGFEALRTRILASVSGAGKALAFAMPSLEDTPGPLSWIGTRANFDSFIDGVLLAAAEQINEQTAGKCLVDRDQEWNRGGPTGNRVTPATLGNLVIAAHSGGGFPMWTAANNHSANLSSLKELWFFDCLYADVDQSWIPYARSHGSVNMEIRYTVFPPKETSANLAKKMGRAATTISNIRSCSQEPSNNHNSVPPNNIGPLIRASKFL
jgi:hypothetical protein